MVTYISLPDYILRNIAGDNVLIKTRNSEAGNTNAYVFNESGAFLWKNLSARKSKEQLVTLLMDNYGIEKTQAETDVDLFLDKCLTEGFISEEKEGK